MKKSVVKCIVLAVVLVLMLACLPVFMHKKTGQGETVIKWSNTITKTNNHLSSESSSIDFTIPKEGEYNLYISLIPEGFDKNSVMDVDTGSLGFVTASVVENSKGDVVYTNVSGAVFLDTTIILEAGDYKLTHYYFTDEEKFFDFATTYICSAKQAEELIEFYDFPGYAENANTVFCYEFSFDKTDDFRAQTTIWVLWGILVGIVSAVLLFELLLGDGGKQRFDERQIMEQGKAFKLGFYTMLIITGILACLNFAVPNQSGNFGLYHVMGLFVSISVYLVYSIWTESYFAINQSTAKMMIFFAVVAALNLVISIVNILHGQVIVNGVPTFRILNIMCTMLFAVIFITALIRKAVNEKSLSSEDEEEDE